MCGTLASSASPSTLSMAALGNGVVFPRIGPKFDPSNFKRKHMTISHCADEAHP